MKEIKKTLGNIPEEETSRQTYLKISSEIGRRLLENLDNPFYPSDLFEEINERNSTVSIDEIEEILQIWKGQGMIKGNRFNGYTRKEH